METSPALAARIDQLVDLFNRQSMDLPDGLFDRRTQFVLNGVAFEEMLGRSPSDPLILMLARGPAGYRFAVKALQHAVPDGRVQRGELRARTLDDHVVVEGQCWLSGHFRSNSKPAELVFDFELSVGANGAVERVNLTMPEPVLAELRVARVSP